MIYSTMLITGCAGDIAISLARIARETAAVRRLIGCDVHVDHVGQSLFDVCGQAPPAEDAGYLEYLGGLIETHGVDVIVPMSEGEIARLLAIDATENFKNVPVIAANRLAIETGLDKCVTFQRLSEHGLGTPWTRVVGESPPASLPCIIKLRRGRGGKSFRLVETEREAEVLSRTRAGDLWQEHLLPDDQEYTCGLYRTRMGQTRFIVLRRRLDGGITRSAEVADGEPFAELLNGIADVVDLKGSINVQLRLTAAGPKVFEINPRFSSTVRFRHMLGFRDFIWSLHESRGFKIEAYCPPVTGTRMYRYAEETILA